MAKLNYSIFCEYSLISREGTPSFVGVFSEIIAKDLPTTKSMSLVINFTPDNRELQEIQCYLNTPDSKKQEIYKTKLMPPSSRGGDAGYIITIPNLKLESAGTYEFEILLNNEKIGVIPLIVELQK